jgi:hypothetical protein
MKYHIHCHSLVTFGGLSPDGQWEYPKRKIKIARYRSINSSYRDLFLEGLQKLYDAHQIQYHMSYEPVKEMVSNKKWVVHNTPPTIDTSILENYLARYINRVAISRARVSYLQEHKKVKILYNDYTQQINGQPAPKASKQMDPLLFINQFLQHLLPPYFQKTRRYGLHASPTKKKHAKQIHKSIKRNGHSVRTVLQIINQLIKENPFECAQCQSKKYSIEIVSADRTWALKNVHNFMIRPPPNFRSTYNQIHEKYL